VLCEFGRRLIADNLNANATYDAYCFKHGGPPPPSIGLRRPRCKTLSRVAGQQLTFANGSAGSWKDLDVIWELKAEGLLDALDFTEPSRTHWVLSVIQEYIGSIHDQEILSVLFEEVQ
jgi:hypothetical protein